MKNTLLLIPFFVTAFFAAPVNPVKKQQADQCEHLAAPAFLFLRVHETGKGGYNLQWKMNRSAGIQSFAIECTYEDASDPYSVWMRRGQVAATPGVNMFKDNNLLPGIINYRIVAMSPNNVPVAVSEVITMTVD